MRSLDIRGALRRRWYVLLLGTLATLALAAAAFVRIGPAQEIRASALLLPPTVSVVTPAPATPVNPFLRLDGIDPALDVLVTKLMADDFSERVLKGAPSTDYTVGEDPLSQAPVVVVTASGSDADEAATILDRVTREMPEVFDTLQADAGVKAAARISLVPLVRDEVPQVVYGGLVRIEILLLGAGLVGTLLLAGLWDALSRSRAAARLGDRPATESAPVDADPDPVDADPVVGGSAAARDEPSAPDAASGTARPVERHVNQSRRARKNARRRAAAMESQSSPATGGDAVPDVVPDDQSDNAGATAS